MFRPRNQEETMMNTFRMARDSVTPGHRGNRLKNFWKRKRTYI